ncbi:mitochondrial small ribosomal subunit protein [Malassezia pachydermatis]
MYQQRWRSKRLLRGYHGDWIPERRFKRWFLPSSLPSFHPAIAPQLKKLGHDADAKNALDTPTPPVKSLFVRDVERRIDTVVFRCCFAHSVYYARSMVLHGKVTINGTVVKDPGHLLQEGDLISVEPECIPMLNKHVAKRVQADRERLAPKSEPPKETAASEEANPTEEAKSNEASEESTEATTSASETENSSSTETSDSHSESTPSAKSETENNGLPQGVLPFNLPPFAAPFLFIPSYLDVSFRTCSAIYLHHPSLTTQLVRSRDGGNASAKTHSEYQYRTEIPSPYPAGGDMFGLAWELYVRNAPRVRADERRTKLLGRYGRNGFEAARAFEQDRRRVAIRRGWGRKRRISLPASPLKRSATN